MTDDQDPDLLHARRRDALLTAAAVVDVCARLSDKKAYASEHVKHVVSLATFILTGKAPA